MQATRGFGQLERCLSFTCRELDELVKNDFAVYLAYEVRNVLVSAELDAARDFLGLRPTAIFLPVLGSIYKKWYGPVQPRVQFEYFKVPQMRRISPFEGKIKLILQRGQNAVERTVSRADDVFDIR